MAKLSRKLAQRRKRHLRVRRKISGTAERPRLSVFKSLKHVSAQLIDDTTGATLVSASTEEAVLAEGLSNTGNIAAAKVVGAAIAKRALEVGIEEAVFDRGGWPMHGKIAALAESAREAGLSF